MRGEWLTLVETPSRLQSRLLDTLAFSFTWEAPLDPHFLSELTFYCPPFGVGVALHSPFERLLFAEQMLTTLRPCSGPVTASLPTLSPPQTHTHSHRTPSPLPKSPDPELWLERQPRPGGESFSGKAFESSREPTGRIFGEGIGLLESILVLLHFKIKTCGSDIILLLNFH